MTLRQGGSKQLTIGGILHQKQQWFHSFLEQDESVERLKTYSQLSTRNSNGLFLVREKVQFNSFVLCVFFQNNVYHYTIDMDKLGLLLTENGQRFENLPQLVDHYSQTADELICKLNDPCPVSYFNNAGPASTFQLVRRGPQRIDQSEITVLSLLGMYKHIFVSWCMGGSKATASVTNLLPG